MTYFKVKLSNQDSIALDEEELRPVCEGIRIKSPLIACKRGIFNAAFYVDIIPDFERMRKVEEDLKNGVEEKKFPSPFARLLGGETMKKIDSSEMKSQIAVKSIPN